MSSLSLKPQRHMGTNAARLPAAPLLSGAENCILVCFPCFSRKSHRGEGASLRQSHPNPQTRDLVHEDFDNHSVPANVALVNSCSVAVFKLANLEEDIGRITFKLWC